MKIFFEKSNTFYTIRNITYWDMYLYFIIVSIKLENENIKYLYNNIYYIYIIIIHITHFQWIRSKKLYTKFI